MHVAIPAAMEIYTHANFYNSPLILFNAMVRAQQGELVPQQSRVVASNSSRYTSHQTLSPGAESDTIVAVEELLAHALHFLSLTKL